MQKNNIIEIILEKTLLSNIIKPYTTLQHKGEKKFLGRCPFHEEKTPSFHVDDEKGLYHCFGCKASGNAITFISEKEHISKKDVITRLANTLGIELSAQVSKKYTKEKELASSLKEINAFSAKQWNHYLLTHPESDGMKYLQKRDISLKTIRDFMIGFSPLESHFLSNTILPMFSSVQENLVISSLFYKTQSIDNPIKDRFTNRIIFPINNVNGEVIAFGSRVLDNSLPKYINTNETLLFKKKETLYGLDKAKSEIIKKKNVYLVEGYFDVLAMNQFGFLNTVATLGTAFSEFHLNNLEHMVHKVTFLFDGDAAGIKAAERSIEICLKKGMEPLVAVLPNGMDPYDYLFSFGESSLQTLLENSTYTWVEFLIKPIKEEIRALEQRKLIQKTVLMLKIIDPLLTNEFMGLLSQTLEIEKTNLQEYFIESPINNDIEKPKNYLSKTIKKHDKNIKQEAEWTIITILLSYPDLYKEYKNDIGPIFFTLKETQEIFIWITENQSFLENEPPIEEIIEKLPSLLKKILLKKDTLNTIKDYNPKKILKDTFDLYQLMHIKENIKEMSILIKEAETEKDQKEIKRLMEILRFLKKDEISLREKRGINNNS